MFRKLDSAYGTFTLKPRLLYLDRKKKGLVKALAS